MNDITYTATANYFELGEAVDARIAVSDFAIFLHRNPGARRLWEARESRLAEGREITQGEFQEETTSFDVPYVKWVMEALGDLDQGAE